MANTADQAKPEAYILSLLAEGRYGAAFEAIAEFGSGCLYAPDFSNHAICLMEGGRLEAAEELFRKALLLDPNLAPAHSGLGILYLRQGKPRLAVPALQQAVSLNPGSPGALTALGIALCNSGKVAEAIPHLVRALEASPDLPAAANALREIRKALSSALPEELRAEIDSALKRAAEAPPESSARPTLSVCMIVKNEENTLARCLRSIQKAADEILVVDTGSQDRTVEIARQFRAKIGHFEWCDDFAAARNHALSLAACDWILIMDADDEMDPGGEAGLRLFLDNRPQAEVCSLRTRIPCPGGLETFIEHPRLFRNHIGLHYVNGVHEQLVHFDGRQALPQVATGISVYHHGYLGASDEMDARRARNLRILQAEAARRPDDPMVHFFLGKEYRNCRRFEEDLPYFRRALELTSNQPASFIRLKTYSYLAEALIEVGRPEEAVRLCQEGLENYPDNAELWFGLGEARRVLGQEEEAIHAYTAATRGRFGTRLANQDFLCRDLKPRLRLAETALSHGRPEEAEAHWRKAHAIRGDVELLRTLRRRIDEARAKMQAAAEIEARIAACRDRLRTQPGDFQARAGIVSTLLAAGRAEEAENEAAAAAYLAPDSPEALNLHGTALASCRRFEEAERLFARALEGEPNNPAILCNYAAVQQRLGRVEQAFHAFLSALEADGECVIAYLGLGDLFFGQREWDKALESYEAAAKKDPQQIGAWLGLARAYLEKSAFKASLTCYEKAVHLSNAAPEIMAELTRVRCRLLAMSQPASRNLQ